MSDHIEGGARCQITLKEKPDHIEGGARCQITLKEEPDVKHINDGMFI
jgi:hypothetical protein